MSEHVLEVAGDLAGPGVPSPTNLVTGCEIERTLYRSITGDLYFHTRLLGLGLMEPAGFECARDFLIVTKTPPWIAEVGLGCTLAEISPADDASTEPTEATP